jgi:hypothetical protein
MIFALARAKKGFLSRLRGKKKVPLEVQVENARIIQHWWRATRFKVILQFICFFFIPYHYVMSYIFDCFFYFFLFCFVLFRWSF